MSKIITITFNPCIDKSTTVDAIVPEKKLRCATPKFEPGGGGVNVSRAIRKLGGDSIAIYPSGGHTGNFLNALLEREGVKTSIMKALNPTRENMIVVENSSNHQYRFGMPGMELYENEWEGCLQLLQESKDVEFIVASGSLPPGVPEDIFAQIAVIAKEKNAKLIVDTSGQALQFAVEEGTYLIKPNLSELSMLVNKQVIEEDEVEHDARHLIKQGDNQIVVVSMGERGAMMVTETECFHVMPPTVDQKSTVGAGDSMVAGLVLSLWEGKGLKESLIYGVACGTAATMNYGTELCKKDDVKALISKVKDVKEYS